METIIDYVMRLEEEKEMDALDLWTKKILKIPWEIQMRRMTRDILHQCRKLEN